MKEIGGYFGLDDFRDGEYYPDLIRLNLGRTALLFLLGQLEVKHIYLPYFLCDSVTEKAEESNRKISYYQIDHRLVPQLEHRMEEGEYIYLVNYYGQLSDELILEYKKKYGNVIVDHTHAFFQRPLKGIPTIYSCRKFFGLPDGAYVSAEGLDDSDLDIDISGERMGHILGRYEGEASDYYSIMLNNAAGFHQDTLKKMSKLTQNLLRAIDYEKIRQKRNANYAYLEDKLGKKNTLGFYAPDGAFTYPFYSRNAQKIRKELAAKKIYIPCYWNCIPDVCSPESIEYDLAMHILPLPCDQRYDPEELSRMVEELLCCLEKYGE